MSRRHRYVTVAVFLLVWVAPGLATGQTINLHWDGCDSWAFDKPWTGPGLYRQVVTGWGFDAPMRGYSIRIRATSSNVYDTPTHPPGDAWRFDPAGCNAGNASANSSLQPCPSLGTGATVDVTYEGIEGISTAVYITLSAHHDVVDPSPGQSYVLGEILYDHTGSASGPQNPAVACGNAQEPVCFIFRDAVWYDAADVAHPIGYDYFMGVSWGNGEGHCFGDLPVQPAAWTAVKRLYD